MAPTPVSTPRSTPGARSDQLRARRHADMIGQPLRTFRSTRAGLSFHDQLRRLANIFLARRPFRIIGKTSSTHAAALAVPPAIRPDSTSPFWARSDQLRSMFPDFEWLFPSSPRSPGKPPGNAKVGVFTARSLEHDCSARACGPDEPGGGPGGPGGEAQWPDGGSTAWTERATKSPGRVKG